MVDAPGASTVPRWCWGTTLPRGGGYAEKAIRTSGVASASVKASIRAPSSVTATLSDVDSAGYGRTVSVARSGARVIAHVPEHPVDEDRAEARPVARRQRYRTPVGVDPGPVGVGQQQVVVLGQEPHGCRGVRVGPRRVGQVEQLGAGLV